MSIQSEAKEIKVTHHAHNESLITQVQPAKLRSREATLEDSTIEARDASIIHDGFAIKEMSVVHGVGT